jgi:hypothetical protein
MAPPIAAHFFACKTNDQRIQPAMGLDQLVAMEPAYVEKAPWSMVDETLHCGRTECAVDQRRLSSLLLAVSTWRPPPKASRHSSNWSESENWVALKCRDFFLVPQDLQQKYRSFWYRVVKGPQALELVAGHEAREPG